MPTLTIPDLPIPVHHALNALAAQDGLTIEAEVCRILTAVCLNNRASAASLQQVVEQLYQGKQPVQQVEQLLQERKWEAGRE